MVLLAIPALSLTMTHEFDDKADSECDAIDSTAQDWFVLIQAGEPTEEDRRQFKAWLEEDPRHRAVYDELETVWAGIDGLRTAFEPSAPRPRLEAVGLAEESTASRPPQVAPTRSIWPIHIGWGSLAAAVVLFVVFLGPGFMLQLEADHLTGVGEQSRVELPDGSTAWLNTDSAISVDFSDERRRITLLRGEVQFDVSPDAQRPFTVAAENGSATAVGTVFTVRDFERVSTVTVVEGKVAVSLEQQPTLEMIQKNPVLTESQQIRLLSEEVFAPIEAVRLSYVNTWRDGFISIQDLPVDEAIREIDRYRPGRIILMADEDSLQSVTARLSIDTIDDGLNAIAASNGLSVFRVTDYLVIVR